MSTNGANTADDADMMECDGEKVVTMMDVLKEQREFEENANAVLGGSDDKNCTYPKGYIKRQAIYACMTCTNAREDSSKRAGVCLACSLNCHESHELVELYTKRNFRCDCGNPKFNSNPCQFTSNKTDLNAENKYNQNFSGLYCVCHRPYPDPDSPSEDMIQCTICEDWLHSSHLDAIAPSQEHYTEMVCKECMEKNNFLHDYSDLAVFADNVNVTKITNDESDINISVVENVDVNEIQNDTITSKQDDSIHFNNHSLNHTNQSEKSQNSKEENRDALTKDGTDVQIEEKIVNECLDNNSNSEAVSEKSHHDGIDLNNLPANDKTEVEASESALTNKENNSTAVDLNSTKENEMNSDSKQAKDDDYKISEKDENELLRDEDMDDITEKKLSPQKNIDVIEKEDENTERNHSPVKNNDNEATVNEESVANDSKSNVSDNISSCDEKIDQGVTDSLTNSNNTDDNIETENNLDAPTDIEKTNKVTDETIVGNDGKVNDEVSSENGDNLKKQLNVFEETMDISENTEINNSSDVNASDKVNDEVPSENGDNLKERLNVFEETMEISKNAEINNSSDANASDKEKENNLENSSESNEKKRKHIDNEELVSNKKPKLSDINCLRPRGVKRIFKGATFWPHNFRQKLCTCRECLTMYKDLSVLFLIDPEDTVSAYEHLGKEKSNGATPSQYEKGLEALSSLDRVQQINALTEYNKMRDKLLDFLKSFKDRDEVVKEEDIKAFFAGMKPKREPDGVYFCR